MVFLAITGNGLAMAIQIATVTGDGVWCGADAISESEYAQRKGARLSRLNYDLQDADLLLLQDALQTIKEHHPGETVWIEGAGIWANVV